MKRGVLVIALALVATGALHGDAPRVTVTLDKSDVSVGDRVVATYTARLPEGTSIDLEALVTPAPAEGQTGPVLDFERPDPAVVTDPKDGQGALYTLKVAFAPVTPGAVSIPGPHFIV